MTLRAARRDVARESESVERTLYNLQAEAAVLGAVLLTPAQMSHVANLAPEAFFRTAHQEIWRSMLTLFRVGALVDPIVLAEELQRTGTLDSAGGFAYLSRLVDGVPRSTRARDYAKIVGDLAHRRELRRTLLAAAERITTAEQDDDILSDVSRALRPSLAGTNDLIPSSRAVTTYLDWLEARQTPGAVTYTLPSGFGQYDRRFGGLVPGFNVIAARPSHGKTALALNFADHLSIGHREPGLFVSSEMSLHMIVGRWLALRGGLSGFDVIRGTVDPTVIGPVAAECANAPLDFMTGRVTVSMIRAKALTMTVKPRYVIVDYVQIIRPEAEDRRLDRHLQVKGVCEGLKELAYELDVPVLALAQLGRAAEDRKEPELRDLREAGDIENEADSALLLHRPNDAVSTTLIMAKNRNGPKGRMTLAYGHQSMKFTETAYDYADMPNTEGTTRTWHDDR